MTADDLEQLKELVRRHVEKEGQQPFADRVGLNLGVVRSLLQGRDLRVSSLQALCESVGLDVTITSRAEASIAAEPARVVNDNYVVVPHVNVIVSAGLGLLIEAEEVEGGTAFARQWFAQHGVRPEAAQMVLVHGDSMAPTVPDGARVLVDTDSKRVDLQGIYCFRRGGEVFIKRLLPGDKGLDGRPNAMVIISDNSTYPTELLTGRSLADLAIIGKVHALLAPL